MHRQHQETGQLPEAREPGYAKASLAFPLLSGSARRGNGKLARQEHTSETGNEGNVLAKEENRFLFRRHIECGKVCSEHDATQ